MAKKAVLETEIDDDIQVRSDKRNYSELSRKYRSVLDRNCKLQESLRFWEQIRKPCIPKQWPPCKKAAVTKASPAVLLSDWHVGEAVSLEKTRGKNEYNLDVAAKRIKRIFHTIPKYIDRYCPSGVCGKGPHGRVLFMGLLGDFITGWIHPGLIEVSTMSPVEECLFFKQQILDGLKWLKPHLKEVGIKRVEFIPKVGNHARFTVDHRDDNEAETSFEWLTYHGIYDMLKSDPFYNSWHWTTAHYTNVVIQGHTTRWHHGHAIKGSAQLATAVSKKISELNKSEPNPVSCDFFGHHHHFLEANDFVCNSSLIGYGARSDKMAYNLEEPSQAFVVISERRGMHHAVRMFADD